MIVDVVLLYSLESRRATMPTKDMSSRIGKSPSPTAERIIKNNTNVQQPYKAPADALADKHTKSPVKI
jgi:hypothetical protein